MLHQHSSKMACLLTPSCTKEQELAKRRGSLMAQRRQYSRSSCDAKLAVRTRATETAPKQLCLADALIC